MQARYKSPFELTAGETFRWRGTPGEPTVLCQVVRAARLVVTFDCLEGARAGQQFERTCMELLVYGVTLAVPQEDA